MNRILVFLFILFSSIYFAQNNKCKLKIEVDSSDVILDGNIKILVRNIGNEKTKILKYFNPYKVQILNALLYSKNNKEYIPLNLGTADIDFFLPEKTVRIKPNETKIFIINIFDTFQGKKYLNRNNNYHFDLRFDFADLVDYKSKCQIINVDNIVSGLKYEPN